MDICVMIAEALVGRVRTEERALSHYWAGQLSSHNKPVDLLSSLAGNKTFLNYSL